MPTKFAAASAVLVAVAIAAGAVGCGSASAGQATGAARATPAPSGSVTASTPAKPIPTPSRSYGPPSHILVDPSGPGPKFPAVLASGNDIQPLAGSIEIVKNQWGTADGKTTVLVDAGAARFDPSDGLFVIVRQTQAGGQSLRKVTIANSGAVRISSAPLGAGVETSAQTGDLSFASDSGMTGILHLCDDTITIGPGVMLLPPFPMTGAVSFRSELRMFLGRRPVTRARVFLGAERPLTPSPTGLRWLR